MWLDYFEFQFQCKAKTDGWLEVIVNNETNEALGIRETKATKFLTWEDYFKSMFAVYRLDDEWQKIRTSPGDDNQEVNYQGNDCFQVKSLNGDWIEIFTSDYCKEYGSKTKIISGWIKWKRGNKLLIGYQTTS